MKPELIEHRFTYHPPTESQPERYDMIRASARDFGHFINQVCPDCLEKLEALNRLDEVVFWANASIARNE